MKKKSKKNQKKKFKGEQGWWSGIGWGFSLQLNWNGVNNLSAIRGWWPGIDLWVKKRIYKRICMKLREAE